MGVGLARRAAPLHVLAGGAAPLSTGGAAGALSTGTLCALAVDSCSAWTLRADMPSALLVLVARLPVLRDAGLCCRLRHGGLLLLLRLPWSLGGAGAARDLWPSGSSASRYVVDRTAAGQGSRALLSWVGHKKGAGGIHSYGDFFRSQEGEGNFQVH